MNIVNNILKKAPFKTDQQENENVNNAGDKDNSIDTNLNQEETSNNSSAFNIAGNLTGNLTGQVSGGVNYVSNIFKSTFKSDTESKSRKDSLESNNETKESKKDSLAAGATNFMTNVWGKSTSLFKQTDDNNEVSKNEDELNQYSEDTKDDINLLEKQSNENVSQKALDSAKNFGNFMFSMANKAGQTVSATAKQIKKTVESTNLLADFSKEQQEFIKQHGGNIQVGEPPWVGCEDEEEMKKQILSLSEDKRNFVRCPPTGVQFDFDLQQMLPVCLTLLKEDENLNKMRFEIVPKLVNEENFWRNYFYRVSLVKQSNTLDLNSRFKRQSSSSESEGPDDISPTNPEPEFVSDYLQGDVSEEDLMKGMRQMGVSKVDSIKDDKQWEDELTKDLQEFEVVNNDNNDAFEAELAKELAEMK